MKYLRVLLALSMLFCGFSGHARADGIDFRATVLDGPNNPCIPDNTQCFIHDPSENFNVSVSQAACPGNVTGDAPFGCFVGNNVTGKTITSLTLIFTGAPYEGQSASCDSAGQGNVPSALLVVSCEEVPDPKGGLDYVLKFAGGKLIPTGTDFVFFEQGANPSDFIGTGTIGVATPEPDSVILLSTGVMMAGLFAFWQRRRVSFGTGRV
jgi:hypothetical protein